MSKITEDKDGRMIITVEKGDEVISFQTDPDLHISEFRNLMMRLAAAVGYHQSNIEEYFLQDEEKSECYGAKYNKPNEKTIRNFQSDFEETNRKAPNVDMGGNYDED